MTSSLKRKLGFKDFDVYAFTTPSDGHCMLHSIAMAVYPSYWRENAPKLEIVKRIRSEMLIKLQEKNESSGKSNYLTIADGNFAEGMDMDKQDGMSYLKRLLSSSQQLGEEVRIVLQFFTEKNILVVDARSNALYTKYEIDSSHSTIVLYYSLIGENENGDQIGHFEPLAVRDSRSGEYTMHFDSWHPFIRRLLR